MRRSQCPSAMMGKRGMKAFRPPLLLQNAASKPFRSPLTSSPITNVQSTQSVRESSKSPVDCGLSTVKTETLKVNQAQAQAQARPGLKLMRKRLIVRQSIKPQEIKPDTVETYYRVLYCKTSNKKRKTYNDGIVVLKSNHCLLKDMEGLFFIFIVFCF